MNLIPTTEIIKNINVVYDEVIAEVDDNTEFIINEITTEETIEEEFEQEEQIMLTFDLPLSSNEPEKVEEKPPTKRRIPGLVSSFRSTIVGRWTGIG